MKECKRAFSEVSEIIKLLPDKLNKKIPDRFKQIIEREKDVSYTPNIDEIIAKNQLIPETIVILGMIYKKFLIVEYDFDIVAEKLIEEIENMTGLEEN